MDNPYVSPEFSAEPVPDAPRIRVLAVVVGWLADVAFSLIFGIVLGVIAAVPLLMEGIPAEQIEAELKGSTWFMGLSVLLGLCGTAFGGYVAAWMGKVLPVRHGFAVAMLSILSGFVPLALAPEMQPMWVSVTGLALALPAGMLGGYLRGAHIASD